MNQEVITALEAVVQRLVGLPCWSVQVSGVGSLANLQFGDKIRREHVMALPSFQIDVDERVYQGEVVLYLEECPWRLDGPDAVLCSWMDDSSPQGRLTQGLNQLKDKHVRSASITRPGLDLTITFDDDLTLRIFPDQADPDEGDNYSINSTEKATGEQQTFIIAAQSTLYIE